MNKSVSGDLLPKWHAGDNIHALPAFAVAPGHPSVNAKSRSCCCNIPTEGLNCIISGNILPNLFLISCVHEISACGFFFFCNKKCPENTWIK